MKTFVVSIVAFFLVFMVPFQTSNTEIETLPHGTKVSKSSYMDMGEREVATEGIEGRREVTTSKSATLFIRIFSSQSIRGSTEERVLIEPTDEIIKEGTRRYQYMACSGGGHMYFTDEQFASSMSVGYTSNSPDECKKNGLGYKLHLSHSEPLANTYTHSGGGAICRDGWRSYSTGRGTCSHHGGVAYWL